MFLACASTGVVASVAGVASVAASVSVAYSQAKLDTTGDPASLTALPTDSAATAAGAAAVVLTLLEGGLGLPRVSDVDRSAAAVVARTGGPHVVAVLPGVPSAGPVRLLGAASPSRLQATTASLPRAEGVPSAPSAHPSTGWRPVPKRTTSLAVRGVPSTVQPVAGIKRTAADAVRMVAAAVRVLDGRLPSRVAAVVHTSLPALCAHVLAATSSGLA